MKKDECIVTLEIDALAPETVNATDMPFLYNLSKKHYNSRIKTTLTFTQFVEIFAGLKPDQSDFWTIFKKDKKNSSYKWVKPYIKLFKATNKLGLENLNNKFIDYFTIFRQLIQGKTFFVSKSNIPLQLLPHLSQCSEQAICAKNIIPGHDTIFDIIRKKDLSFVYIALPLIQTDKKKSYSFFDFSDEKVTKTALKFVKEKNYNFYHLYFRGVDSISHYNGLNSAPVKKRAKEIDDMIKKIYYRFKAKNKKTTFLIFSDHGMVNVKKHINIIKEIKKTKLKEGKDYLAFYDSTLARFWAKGAQKEIITKTLNNIKGGRILTEEDQKKFNVNFDNNKYGDILYVADPEVLIMPNYFQGTKPVLGMHTYDPVRELDGMFIHENKPYKSFFKETLDITKLYDIMKDEIN